MIRDYTPLPFEYLDELDCLSDAEYGRLIRGLQMYGMTGEEPELKGNEKAHWKRVRNRDDRYRESWDAEHDKKSEAGKKGASKRWQGHSKNSIAISANGKNGYTDTNTETNTNTNKPPKGGNKRTKFIPPTLEEVRAYARERNSGVDPKKFFDYYDTGNWKDAKGNPVRNWKQKFLTWEKNDTPQKQERPHGDNSKPRDDTKAMEQIRKLREKMNSA